MVLHRLEHRPGTLRTIVVTGVLVVMAIAGCVDEPQLLAVDPELIAAAIIRGIVVHDEAAPIPEARVRRDAQLVTATTEEAGASEFSGLAPATNRAIAEEIGYTSAARSVNLGIDEIVQIELALELVPVREQYVEMVTFTGNTACGWAAIAFVRSDPNPCPIAENPTVYDFLLAASWAYMVREATWDTDESMWRSTTDPGGACNSGAPCPGVIVGPSPVRMDGAPLDADLAARYALDHQRPYQPGPVQMQAWTRYAGLLQHELDTYAHDQCNIVYGQFGIGGHGCLLGVGYFLGTTYDEYLSIFYWQRPPDPGQYTGLPS